MQTLLQPVKRVQDGESEKKLGAGKSELDFDRFDCTNFCPGEAQLMQYEDAEVVAQLKDRYVTRNNSFSWTNELVRPYMFIQYVHSYALNIRGL